MRKYRVLLYRYFLNLQILYNFSSFQAGWISFHLPAWDPRR